MTPCKECVSIAICRHKEYLQLFDDCSIIKSFVPDHRHRHIRNSVKIKLLCNDLKPTKWKYRHTEVINIHEGEL